MGHLYTCGSMDRGGLTRTIGFYSCSFKDAEKQYSVWKKGLFVVSLALQEAEKNHTAAVNNPTRTL